jgi:hypothetical protein
VGSVRRECFDHVIATGRAPAQPPGQYTSPTLAPGKYYAVATEDSYDATVESIGKLWRSRNRYKEVDVAPGAGALVNLEPVKID